MLSLLLFVNGKILGQDSTEIVVPDGTEGQTMVVSKVDSVLEAPDWNDFDGKYSTLRIGAGLLYDYVTFSDDDAAKEQVRLVPEIKLRDFRFVMSGKFKTKRFFTWKLGIMYDANETSWLVRETGLMVGVPELAGYIFVGRTKEGFSLNKVMNGYAGWTWERQMALDMIPILNDGIKWMGWLPEQRIFWNIGAFADWISQKQSYATYNFAFVTRAGWLPFYQPKKNRLLHLGLNYRYGEPKDGKIQLRSKPEVNPFPYFISTGTFAANHSNIYGWEAYFQWGSLMLGTEGYFNQFSSPDKGNPLFKGGEAEINYILTGEARPYSTVSGIYGFVPVKKSVFDGGWGAWEVLVRVSSMDLNGGTIEGGKFWRITPMVNWFLSKDIRMEFGYGYGVLDRYDLQGHFQFFQSRIQLAFL